MSEIRANTVSDAAGTGPVTLTGQYAAKAWVNFNGTGTVAIRESGSVASITDNGTGDYTLNYTSALADANYAYAVEMGISGASDVSVQKSSLDMDPYPGGSPTYTMSTTQIRLQGKYVNASTSGAADSEVVTVMIIR